MCISFYLSVSVSPWSSSFSSSSSIPSFLSFPPSISLLLLLPLCTSYVSLYFSLPVLLLFPLSLSPPTSFPPSLHLLTDSGRGPVDSPVQWKEAFIGPLCSTLPEANGIQMWPSTVVTAAIYGAREKMCAVVLLCVRERCELSFSQHVYRCVWLPGTCI